MQANPKDRRLVLAEAVRHVPRSVKVWMKCIDAEDDSAEGGVGADGGNSRGESSGQSARVRQRLVCRRSLQLVPESVALWRRCVELEDDNEDAKVMLRRAIECVPAPVSADFRLALARLETYESQCCSIRPRCVLCRARHSGASAPSPPRVPQLTPLLRAKL